MNLTRISDPLIRRGVMAAIDKNLLPAAAEKAYPGHFYIVADGSFYGGDSTWPGLDSWQMAGAYLLLGKRELVKNYFAFVCAAQRPDGNVPLAIVPGDAAPPGLNDYGRGMRWPQDVYSYGGRKWIGLFRHWQMKVNPISSTAAICFILTADEIGGRDHLDSVALAGKYLLSRISENGLLAGAGFYIENPPRNQWDGVTQCYGVRAFTALAKMTGDATWQRHADELAAHFRDRFWRDDHFSEYVHPEHGVVDAHGLSDTNWAAIAWDVATDGQQQKVWPKLMAEKRLWAGDMPTQLVAGGPTSYEKWELPEPLPFNNVNGPVYDVAAMGRVWFLEASACVKMKAWDRLRESTRLVCAAGEKNEWMWYERYHIDKDGKAQPHGPRGYCEYPAVLARIVLGNLDAFA